MHDLVTPLMPHFNAIDCFGNSKALRRVRAACTRRNFILVGTDGAGRLRIRVDVQKGLVSALLNCNYLFCELYIVK